MQEEETMASGALGKLYRDGEVIVRQGEPGRAMYVIQEGTVDIIVERDGRQVLLRTAGAGEIVGEMAIVDREVRSATVRVKGEARILTVDKKTFLRRITEDPSLAFRVVEIMSGRIRELSREVASLMAQVEALSPGGGGSASSSQR
jgi:CRP-like cAMP-binding protein